MAFVTSTSTDAEVRAAYDDNASYDIESSPTKCQAFIVAARLLLRREPAQAGRAGSAFSLDKQSVREALSRAETWLAANPPASSTQAGQVRFLSLENFRS